MCHDQVHPLPGDQSVDVNEIMPFTDEDKHFTLLQREFTPEFIPTDVATQFARFESGELQRLGYPSRLGLPFADP